MMSPVISEAIWGMLQYYGVISITDLLVICEHCSLCKLADYKVFLHMIQKDIVEKRRAFLCKKFICHKDVKNPMALRDLQKSMVAKFYKEFSLEEYLLAAQKAETPWNTHAIMLEAFLQEHSLEEKETITLEISRLRLELNNMTEVIPLTLECLERLGLIWDIKSPGYMALLEGICNMGQTMPRWYCKGYSYAELMKETGSDKGE